MASGRDLLGPEFIRCRDRLDRDLAGEQNFRLHEVRCRHSPEPGPARGHFRPEQPAYQRPGDCRRCRRKEGRLRRAEARPGLASSRAAVPRIGAEPSDDRRIGLAIRYIPTHLKQAVGQKDWATLVRGKDSYGHFQPEYVPKRDLEPEALAFHKAVSEEQVRVLYRGTGKTAYRA